MHWHLYVLVSASGTETYVGISTDVERRLAQHNGELPGGARTTTRGRPWSLGAKFGPFESRAEAQSAEWDVKQLRGVERLTWSRE